MANKVGDFVDLRRGVTYKGDLVGKPGPALLGLGSITPGGGFRNSDFKTYGGDCPASIMLGPGDLFVSLKGATKDGEMIGSIARVPTTLPAGRLTQDTVKLIFKPEAKGNESYLYWCLRTPQYRAFCAGVARGSAVVALSREDFLSYQIPDRDAGRDVIVAVLELTEEKIELNRKTNETLEQMAQALFKSWFVDFDPVHAKAAGRQPAGMDKATADLFPDSFADSELGKIPKGWRIGALGEIATNPRRGMQPEDIAPGTPYIGLEHMPRRSIALGEWEDSIVVESGKSGFKKGEILFGKLRPYFHKVGIAPMDGVCSTDILVLAPVSQAWFGPLLSYASSDELIQFTNLASTGTKMPRTNWRDVSSFKIIIPTHELADGYSKIISSLTAKIAQNLSQSKTLSATRDALLPRLIGDRQFIEARK